jgi:hypothetical protein
LEEVDYEHDGCPTEDDVERHIKPAGGADPEDPKPDAECRPSPNEPQQKRRFRRREREHCDRGVRARDEQENVGVIEALQKPPRAFVPIEPVVECGNPEQEQG